MKAVFKSTGGGSGKDPVRDFTIHFSPGQVIFHEGELGTEMYIIQDGEVNIVRKLRGEKHILSKLERGDFFGEMSVIDGTPRTADAVAATDVRLLVINGARFDEMLRKTPEIAIRIIRKYSKRLRDANAMLERLLGEEVHLGATVAELAHPSADKAQSYRIVDTATGTAFFLSPQEETTIGRSDPVTGIMPDIDLSVVDSNRSVSRKHSKILRTNGEYSILEEVGTVNGTYVNDQRIPTGSPVPIRDGDRLKIGLLSFKVIFEN